MKSVAVAMVIAAGLAAGSGSAAAAQPAAEPGTQLWVSRYNGPGDFRDFGSAVAVSPDGRRVFVTGRSSGKGTGPDYATVAYNAVTGHQVWVSRYRGPGDSLDTAHSVVVSPDSRTVFVTGSAGADATTIAYSAATGARRWVSSFRGSGCCSRAWSAAVSANGSQVFVTGGTNTAVGAASGWSIRTIAYTVTTGAQLWTSSYTGPGGPGNLPGYRAVAVVASPAGGTVYVAGISVSSLPGQTITTIAYNGRTGAQRWVGTSNCCGSATSLVVSHDGSQVITAGTSLGRQEVISYDAATGAQLWTAFPVGGGLPTLVASPVGDTVFAVSSKISAYQAATGRPGGQEADRRSVVGSGQQVRPGVRDR